MNYQAPPFARPEQLPQLIDQVHTLNGRYLIYRGFYILVEEAHRNKARYLQHSKQAVDYKQRLSISIGLSEYERGLLLRKMESEATQAGRKFGWFAGSLGRLDDDPIRMYGIPQEISSNPELSTFFYRGFECVKAACYSE